MHCKKYDLYLCYLHYSFWHISFIYIYIYPLLLLLTPMATRQTIYSNFKSLLLLSFVIQAAGFGCWVSSCQYMLLTDVLKNVHATQFQRLQTARIEDLEKFLPTYLLEFRYYSCRTTIFGESTKMHLLEHHCSKY